ncbi:hypothetical protein WJX81_006651 [Elliptochloris bilobata]|uniref:PROP1-like PPR domain-containing protein n=1 Tax=Elliptochloris bilobata TaxID=381761 RepID=A0AAW1PZA7_9CHLO
MQCLVPLQECDSDQVERRSRRTTVCRSMSKKNKKSTKRNRHANDLQREKELVLQKQKKAEKKEEKRADKNAARLGAAPAKTKRKGIRIKKGDASFRARSRPGAALDEVRLALAEECAGEGHASATARLYMALMVACSIQRSRARAAVGDARILVRAVMEGHPENSWPSRGHIRAALDYIEAHLPDDVQDARVFKLGIAGGAVDAMAKAGFPRTAIAWRSAMQAQGFLKSAEGAKSEWVALQGAALPLLNILDVGACCVDVLASAGSSQDALDVAEELLRVYAARWIEVPRHPAGLAGGSFGHPARTAAVARMEGAEPRETQRGGIEAWRGVLGGWRTRDERRLGPQLAHHLRRACHCVLSAAESERDPQLADRLFAAMDWARDLAGAADAFDRMSSAGLSVDAHTYNALLYAHAEAGDLEGVAALYLGLRARWSQEPHKPWRRPTLETFTNLFQAVKRNADMVLAEDASAASATPDATPEGPSHWTWFESGDGSDAEVAAVSQQAATARADELLKGWLRDFRAAALAHSPESAMRLVQALGSVGDVSSARELVYRSWATQDRMDADAAAGAGGDHPPRQGLEAVDWLLVCTAVLDAGARITTNCDRELAPALVLLQRMEERGLRLDEYCFAAAIRIAANAKDVEVAQQLLNDMQERGLEPSAWHWTSVVRAFCRTDDLDAAMRAVDAMIAANVEPLPRTWAIIRRKAAHLGRLDVVALVRECEQGRRDAWLEYMQRRAASSGWVAGWDSDDDMLGN